MVSQNIHKIETSDFGMRQWLPISQNFQKWCTPTSEVSFEVVHTVDVRIVSTGTMQV